jgi:hypothetical protein
MNRTSSSRDVDAPPEAVWSVLVAIDLLPSISPSTVSVDGPPELERVGDEFEQTVKLAGRHFTSTWRVTRFEPRTCLTVAGSVLPGTRYSMFEQVEPLGQTGSQLSLTIEYSLPFGPLGRLAARLGAERAALNEAEQVLDAIAELAESRASDVAAP